MLCIHDAAEHSPLLLFSLSIVGMGLFISGKAKMAGVPGPLGSSAGDRNTNLNKKKV